MYKGKKTEEKSCIQESTNLSTNANSNTEIFSVGVDKGADSYYLIFFFFDTQWLRVAHHGGA